MLAYTPPPLPSHSRLLAPSTPPLSPLPSPLEGNDRCMDCGVFDPDWASINHGTLICLQCVGRHRALGVQVSFCKSTTMDGE